jgi:hypothetical protein
LGFNKLYLKPYYSFLGQKTTVSHQPKGNTLTEKPNQPKTLQNQERNTLNSLEKREKQTQRIVKTTNSKIEKQKELISKLNFDDESYSADESILLTLRKQKITRDILMRGYNSNDCQK